MSSALGRPISIHRGKFSAGLMLWYVGGLFVLGSLVGIFQSLTGKTPASQGGLSGIGLLVGLGVLSVATMRWKQTLEIFEAGFVWKRLIGTRTATRDQIKKVTHVTHSSRRGSYVEVAIELTSGKSLSIVGIELPDQAVEMLAAAASSRLPAASGGWQPPAPAKSSSSTGWIPPGGAQ